MCQIQNKTVFTSWTKIKKYQCKLAAPENFTGFKSESKENIMHRLIDQNKRKAKTKSISPDENHTIKKNWH